MRKCLALLLLGTAAAQQGASIEDMLRDTSNTMPAPAPAPSPDISSSGGPPAVSPSGSIGGLLGAMAASTGDTADQKPDMFGRKPSTNPMGGLFGGGGGGNGGGGGGGGPSNPIMDSLLKSVESRMPLNQKLAAKKPGYAASPAAISQESKQIVAGIVEAFMHRVKLLPGEKACLENNLATLTFDVVGAATDLAKGVKAIIADRPGNPAAAVQTASGRSKSQGSLVSAGLDGAMKLTSLVTMATSLLKNCVHGDALEMLKATGRHFINMQYVSHRLLVSGVDVAHRLSDGIIAYEAKDWHRFGQDIGNAIRKILLSNATRGSRLPEGVPEQAIIEETTRGLMAGFFVRGSGVEITDAAVPDVDIQLDLHRCIAGNHEFFKEVWMAMWNLIAQLSVGVEGHGMENPFKTTNEDGSQPKWMGELMIAMMQVPVALSRCSIGQESQQMIREAISSIKYLKVNFLFPEHVMTSDEVTDRMAKAINAWTNWNFKEFGREIGMLLREFVLLMYPTGNTQYPQQYSVDANGRLRRQLIMKDGQTETLKLAGRTFSPIFIAFVVGGVASSMLVAMAAVRGIRSMNHNSHWDAAPDDCEGSSDVELAGNDIEVE